MFVDITGKTRGRQTKEVTYKGIGTYVDVEVEKREPDTTDASGKVTIGKLVKDAEGNQVMTTEKELRTAGVVTDPKAFLAEAYAGNMQTMIDDAVIGYNLRQFHLASDVLAQFLNPAWTDAQTKAFRDAVNAMQKLGATLEVAVTTAKGIIG
jgi:hypothetical protein